MARLEGGVGGAGAESRAPLAGGRLARRAGEGLDEGSAAQLEARLLRVLAERRQTLLRRFGWAGPPLRCAVEPRRRALVLAGEALSRKALAAALAEFAAVLPFGWMIDASATEIAAPRAWLGLPAGVTRLWRAPPAGAVAEAYFRTCGHEHALEDMWMAGQGRGGASGPVLAGMRAAAAGAGRGGSGLRLQRSSGERGSRSEEPGLLAREAAWAEGHVREDRELCTELLTRVGACPEGHVLESRELCTELLAGDGPVGVLAAAGEWTLVRAGDGTIGWTRARLGAPAASPAAARSRGGAAALARALRRFRGAPYRLGGTTPPGIDCSGLVQRAVRSALGLVLPRHSSDQLALAAAPVRALGEPGDLLFMWGAGESPCHVGVVLRGPRAGARTLLHASSRRGRVIEEPLEQVLLRAARWRHMELEQVLALRR
ncbi:NlpC/P60 family protein [Nannocystis exedens]|uniref:NlpC/P60 family protein n=1 Tax=Nannocystis exedens TaxID=54 RepID=A0A1I2BII5_9BACT|nr:NlpC/P60 family protein [Nannocystis exedens]PCC67967.1 Murein DD-endopeptidase MepS/Murein LD-carboxypeptidase precursor [Nannocystis exedens]SFE55747.1 NlpC/P60 family protein [Nannocystis exedens]